MKPQLFILLLFLPLTSLAQLSPGLYAAQGSKLDNGVVFLQNKIPDFPLLTSSPNVLSKKEERKMLMKWLKGLDVTDVRYNETQQRNLYHLATLFTRFRLYPLAMKCFFKTLRPDSLTTDDLPVTEKDEQLLETQVQEIGSEARKTKCNMVHASDIVSVFNDGKQALAYAMVFHVKQPVRGKKKVFKLIYAGHTFITLVKYNTDSTYASITFGFGPRKSNVLEATPIIPSAHSSFFNDAGYPADEVIGKFISRRKFEKILRLTEQYEGVTYHLSTNNCTDFGLKVANIAGLEVSETYGKWPLGKGNSPGITGESILLGKFTDKDTNNQSRLFIDTLKF
jgi:hypothetical protein